MARGKGKNKAGKATVEEVPDEAEVEVRTRREKAVEENAKLREIMGIGRADISKVSRGRPAIYSVLNPLGQQGRGRPRGPGSLQVFAEIGQVRGCAGGQPS